MTDIEPAWNVSTCAFFDHVDHVANRVGPEHMGIGLDYVFDQTEIDSLFASQSHLWPPEWEYRAGIRYLAPEALPQVTEEMLRRGFSEAAVRGVLGRNLFRVAQEVWK